VCVRHNFRLPAHVFCVCILRSYTLGGSDLENELFKGHNGNGNTVNFPQFVTLFRKVLKLTPQQCSDIDVRTVFEYMGGTYVHGVEKNRFKEFLNEDFNLDFVARRLKVLPLVCQLSVFKIVFLINRTRVDG